MSGLIRRADLFNLLATAQTLAEAYAVIQGMPEADAVEVVRCKNCEHCYTADKVDLPACALHGFFVDPTGFCSGGEEKDEGD